MIEAGGENVESDTERHIVTCTLEDFGAVRDALLGRPVADIDVATPAMPDSVLKAVAAAGLKAIPTGIAHGTVTALVGRRPFEITTLRRYIVTDGRHAVVAFSADWQADAARRDFTMNALYADRGGAITDFFGGVADARAGRVRFIGDPERRIAEDALRILRFFRFHAWFGRRDRDGAAACAKLAAMIDRLSGERVRTELFKTVSAPDPAPVWAAMIATGIMTHALPEAVNVAALSAMVAAERDLGLPPDPIRRLAALLGPLPPDRYDRIKDRLKLANRDNDHLRARNALAGRIADLSAGSLGQALYGAPPDWVRDVAMLSHIETGRPDATQLTAFCRFAAGWRAPRFPLTGADLLAAGIPPGPDLGRMLTALESWWIAADFAPDRAACLARLGQTSGA